MNMALLSRETRAETAPKSRSLAKVSRKDSHAQESETCAPAASQQAPPIVHDALRSSGQPLNAAARDLFEPRFGHDFSKVRVHTDDRAAQSAQAVDASAYTVGPHLVFGPGEYKPEAPEGQRLLAHELTHVVQQGSDGSLPSHLTIGAHDHTLEREANSAADHLSVMHPGIQPGQSGKPLVQRQGPPQTTQGATIQPQPPAPTPGFSVNQAEYLKLVTQAVQQMQGRLVESKTLAPTIKPILDALVPQATWVDGAGKQQGGSSVQQQFPGTPPTNVTLRLVLDDSAGGMKEGDFTPAAPTNGAIRIFIQKNPDVDTLTETLYHEALHMMTWLANRPAAPDVTQGNKPQTRALTRARKAPEVQLVRNVLDNIASNINPKRKNNGEPTITPAGLDTAASFLVEETEVRAETVVFEHFLQTQQGVAIGQVTVATPGQRPQSIDVNSIVIDNYVFDFSGVFKPSDRALLGPDDKQSIEAIREILENFYNNQIQRRTAAPGVSPSVPREQVQVPLHPLNP